MDVVEPWESNFGVQPALALGVEEELLLVDEQHALRDRDPEIIDAVDAGAGSVEGELFRAMVEAQSPISATAREAISALRVARREILRSTRLMGVGLHPASEPGQSAVRQTPRFAKIEHSLQGVLRTPICGQHIHVGMPDEETAVRVYNGIRTHVPLLNALAANSPFWGGLDSGLASTRTVVFRSYPRAAMAPEFADYRHFCDVTRQVCVAAGLIDYTHIWWDVRIHPALGTIEVRAADAQFDLRRTAALAALVHCLARIEAERDQNGLPAREALAESSFQATRFGLGAKLMTRSGSLKPARILAEDALALADTVAGELGCRRELGHLELILREGCGADVQRLVHAEVGMDGLLEFLVEETANLDQEAGRLRPAREAGPSPPAFQQDSSGQLGS
jgi:glutamate---cysteine ligase / carboxylate-amine ligase